MAKKVDKRVFDVRAAVSDDPSTWRLVAVSSDAVLPEFYRTIQGAFEWVWPTFAKMLVGEAMFFGGKGSRTPLRRVFSIGDRGMLSFADDDGDTIVVRFEVLRVYEVPSRRHYPKVLDGAGMYRPSYSEKQFWCDTSTWVAQELARYGFREQRPTRAADSKRHLSRDECDELEALMQRRDPACSGPMHGSITCLHGFLTCVISGPLILPSEWFPVVFGDENNDVPWETMQEVQRATSLVMQFYNGIVDDLRSDDFRIIMDPIADGPEALGRVENWCRGFLVGTALRADEWQSAMQDQYLDARMTAIIALGRPDAPPVFDPVKHPREYQEAREVLPQCALDMYRWWRRATPKGSPPPLRAV